MIGLRELCVRISRPQPWWWPVLLPPFGILIRDTALPVWLIVPPLFFAVVKLLGDMLDSSRFTEVDGVE